MTDKKILPAGFDDLEHFVVDWAGSTTQERWDQRSSASMTEIRGFYDAVLERAPAILAYLDPFDIEHLPPDAARLFCLLLSLVNCSVAIELHKAPRAPFSPYPHGVRILKGAAPLG
jgi:hypothetical protein